MGRPTRSAGAQLRRSRIASAFAWALLAAGTTCAAADDKTFAVMEYRVLGNSVLPVKTIEQAVMPHLGPDRTIKDVEAARSELEAAYHRAGFGTVFVDIPEQSVADGIVRLRVTEGKLNSAAITGARYFSERQIKAGIPEAREGSVPNLPRLQAQIAQVNAQTPDRAVVPILKAGPIPGTVDLSLRVQDSLPLHGSVEINDQYTADTTPLRLLATLSYGDLFGRFDSLSAQYETAPAKSDEVGVFAANYSTHVDDAGDQLAVYVLHSNSNIAALGSLAVLGRGTVYGLRWVDPLARQADILQTLTLGVDYKDYSQSVSLTPTSSLNTPVRYTNFSAAYGESRTHEITQLQWSVAADFGPRSGPNNDLEFGNKRYQAPPNYFYVRADASLTFTSAKKWQLLLQLDGQYAPEPLISNEEFSIGGAASVRGYLETEALGDYGIRGSVQLQPPPWQITRDVRVVGFVFVDAARADILDALQSDVPATSLRSAGAGVSFSALRCVSGNLTWADPLVSGAFTRAHDSRWLFAGRCAW
jgi:hemolysin activation/secretion protein